MTSAVRAVVTLRLAIRRRAAALMKILISFWSAEARANRTCRCRTSVRGVGREQNLPLQNKCKGGGKRTEPAVAEQA